MASSVGELSIKLSFDKKSIEASATATQKTMDKVASGMSRSWSATAAIVQDVAVKAFNAATGAIKNFGSSVLSTGMQFEAGMSEVSAISGATGQELNSLTNKAMEMGAKTKFTATESAEAFKYMAMAGWDTGKMLDGIEGLMNLAAASGEDLATTSDIVTDALTAFGLKASDSAHFADVLAKASSSSNTNVSMMGETFKYAAPLAGALGYSIEDVGVAVGLMANGAVKGSQAGTTLRSMLTRLAAPPKEAALAMESLNVSLTKADGTMKPLNAVMVDLRKGFKNLSQEEQVAYAKAIAGQEAMSGLLDIVRASDEDFNNLTNQLNNADGAAANMAATMIDNLEGAFTLIGSAVEGVKLQIFEGFKPAMQMGVVGVQSLVSGITTALQGGDPSVAVGTFISQMEFAMQAGFQQLGNVMQTVLPILLQALTNILPGLISGVLSTINSLINAIITALPGVIDTLLFNLPIILDAIVNFLSTSVPILLNGALQLFLGIIQAIPIVIPALVQALIGLFNTLITFLTDPNNLQLILQASIDLLMAIVESLPTIVSALIEALPTIIDNILTFFAENLSTILDAAIQLFMMLIEALPTIIQAFGEALPKVIDAIVKFITNPNTITLVLDAAITMFNALINSLPTIIKALVDAMPNVIRSIIDFLTNPNTIGMILNAGIQLFFALVNAVPRILGSLIGAFGNLVGGLWESIKSMFGRFAENFGSFISGSFRGAINGVLSFIENFINAPINVLNGFIDVINSVFGAVGVSLGHVGNVSLPRMAQGGIVPGTSYAGDRNMIMANSGEMVITRSQQARLWDAIERGTFGGGEEYENNYNDSQNDFVFNTTITNGFDIDEFNSRVEQTIRRAVA